jgi:hypothetical protein
MWELSDPGTFPAPANTPSAFNSPYFGVTILNAQLLQSTDFRIGIADIRGDGRPDYRYHAHVLYADSASPQRVSINGGAITVKGMGFNPKLTASVGSTAATPLATSAGQMILAVPAHADGVQSLAIADPVSGGSTTMISVLTYGAAASDNLVLLKGLNSATPVGAQATNPVSVQVLAADGVTPVSGATIAWNATNNVQLSACSGASACSVISDESGDALTWLTPSTAGVATITATLAPGAYSSSKSVSATLYATESASDLGVLSPYYWISQGATTSVPLTVRVLSNGTPQSNTTVNFAVVNGSGVLSAASAQTNSSGYATVSLAVTQVAALVEVSACVAPGNAPCGLFYANPVPLPQQNLQPVAGGGQVSTGQAFQPVIVRVTDSSSPPNPVLAAPVAFQTTVLRPGGSPSGGGNGESNPTNPAMPVILKVSQSSTTTDVNGLASIVPSSAGFSSPLEVDVGVTAGASAALDYPLEVFPGSAAGGSAGTNPPVNDPPLRRPEEIGRREIR